MTMFTLSDFTDISTRGFNVVLPDSTVALINELSKLVGSPNYIKTPVFTKREVTSDADKKRRRNRVRPTEISDGWTTASSHTKAAGGGSSYTDSGNIVFNPGGSVLKKGCVNTNIQRIRPLLNKFGSNANNVPIKKKLFEVIDEMFETDIAHEDVEKLVHQIFDILSGNLFYSDIYSKLFGDMISNHSIFGDVLNTRFNSYIGSYNDIRSVDPITEYDSFCDMNKANDMRKSLTSFYAKLYMLGKIHRSTIIDTVGTLTNMVRQHIEIEASQDMVAELVENISILLDNSTDVYVLCKDKMMASKGADEDEDDDEPVGICDYLIQLSMAKQKEYAGLNTKSLFKLKDLIETHRVKKTRR